MLNKLKQMVGLINLPLLTIFMAFVVFCFGMFFVFKKFISTKSSKKSKLSINAAVSRDGNTKTINRKKRNKKQRYIESTSNSIKNLEKQISLSTSNAKSVVTSGTNDNDEKASISTLENNQETLVPKKQEKRRNKSKKKKAEIEAPSIESSSVPLLEPQSITEEGEWQTVRNKEVRLQRKERKRQDEAAAVAAITTAITTNLHKPVLSTTYSTVYPPVSSTAKDVAPRFSRAREEWQDGVGKKQLSVNVTKSTTIVNRSPMVPAAIKQQPVQSSTNWPTTTSSNIPGIWESKTTTAIGFPSAQNATWTSSKDSLPWSQTVATDAWSAKPNSKPWDSTGPPVEKSDWSSESKSDDWVHVTTPSPTIVPPSEPWASSIYPPADWSDTCISAPTAITATLLQQENFQLEPEGTTVTTLAHDDPWNMESYEKSGGDWSPPDAYWSNSNDEWNVSIPVKPTPTYFDESEEEVKISSVPTSSPSIPQNVVGAGNEFLQNQQTNAKKPRRRRKKKQMNNSEATPSEISAVDFPKSIENSVQAQVSSPIENKIVRNVEENATEEAWSVTKASKKKKNRVRKAE